MYTEIHHVIPKCMGGSDEPSNLVKLTPEQHLLAHYILAKLFPKVYGLQFAFYCMSNTRKVELTNGMLELYGDIKRQSSKRASDRMKLKVGELNNQFGKRGELSPNFGRKLSEEHRRKLSASLAGIPKTDKHRERISEAKKGFKHSEVSKSKMSLSRKGTSNRNADCNTYRFIHKSGQVFVGKRFDFCSMHGIRSQCLSAVKSGKQKTVKGWTCGFTPIAISS